MNAANNPVGTYEKLISFNNKSNKKAIDEANTIDFAEAAERSRFNQISQQRAIEGGDPRNSSFHHKKHSVKSPKRSEFLERFEGRNSFMNKEGHLGIVKDAK